ncbi:MAG: chromosome segregation protein [Mycobacterium sp.]|nr:chromosome segregation protein [Mycobacterium sp.]
MKPPRKPQVSLPASVLPHRSPEDLLALSRRGLLEAGETRPPGLRYALAHLAALRAAAAVLAARARPAAPGRRRGGRPVSVWALLAMVAPELGEWATFFAAGAAKRAAAEAGIPRVVTTREADDMLRDAERFLAVVETTLGRPHQPLLAVARAG